MQQLNCDLKKRIHKNLFLVVSVYIASLASAFNFYEAFWRISSMYLLNFNLQSEVMPSSFSLRELFMCKSPILRVLEGS